MIARHRPRATVTIVLAVTLAGIGLGSPALAGNGAWLPDGGRCFAGAHTLSHFGDRLYPDTGNGGYTSVHTGVHLVYDATTDMFLPGNHMDLTDLTFFKEGLATFGEYLFAARNAETAAGGPFSPAGQRAFDRSLINQFDANYRNAGAFWTAAPSNPAPFGLFSGDATYTRPGSAYIALRQILGKTNFAKALQQIQRRYGGGAITEAQLEAGFRTWLPSRSAACTARLGEFFSQWFDTAYPPGGLANRPQITGPGLAGPGFYGTGGCTR
jgi:hypothetical protein